ncbi:glucose-1-phosphate thymidylyltransferase RfbA [Amycolatopsis sp. NPDC005961]|uniref:glucose-1-phosphate thymidylyltransferase RfbA n=1 Tax=Amycolatopsis sp. NPDC005961 TaxID=3156720 RepID=UPI0033C64E16
MKGIILAGGNGTRLAPMTSVVSKQLLPVYDKPMIYYPLSVLLLGRITEILVIARPQDLPLFKQLLGDGSRFGARLDYAAQDSPRGLADALILGREHVGDDDVALILGDNIFHGHDFGGIVTDAIKNNTGATLFGYEVSDPERYGVAALDRNGELVDVVEKPANPPGNLAITGFYLYTNEALDVAAGLAPSPRGELEITDVNKHFVDRGRARIVPLTGGFAWLDAGTAESYVDACNYVHAIETRQGRKIACPEEIAFDAGLIGPAELLEAAGQFGSSEYGQYLKRHAGRGAA